MNKTKTSDHHISNKFDKFINLIKFNFIKKD